MTAMDGSMAFDIFLCGFGVGWLTAGLVIFVDWWKR